MPSRFTRPVLAFSALALLAVLAPAEGPADDAQGGTLASARAPRPSPGEAQRGGGTREDGQAETGQVETGQAADGPADVRGSGETAADPAASDPVAAGGSSGRAPRSPELADNPLFSHDRDGTDRPAAGGGASTDAKAPGGGTGAAGHHRGVPHAGDSRRRGHTAAGDRVARGPAAAPGLVLGAAVGPQARSRALATANALARQAARIEERVAAYRARGLEPLPARPAPPVVKPRVRGAKVVSSVPTDDRVVFLTVDDGAMKSPGFLEMIDDLDIPVTSFLTDEEALLGPGYAYFRALERLGGTTQNHTLHHPYLPALPYEKQRREICGQQDRVQQETGGPLPRLFRPPYGEYDRDTLRAARACGIDAVVLWGAEAWADRIDFQEAGGLYPGAIILTHYRGPAAWGDGGTMVDMLRRVLERAAAEGYAIGRLEDYL